MNELTFSAAFLVGLAGSVHCIGMCGGVVTAFTFATPKAANKTLYVFCYNAGRIFTYTLLGALTGYIGSIINAKLITNIPVLSYISILFLYLLALYISDLWKLLSYLERIGAKFWRFIQPISKKLIPVKSPVYAIFYGSLWGFLPCGLIYSALTWSLSAGDTFTGAGMMLSFGLGTLPALLIISLGFSSLIPFMQHKMTRRIIAAALGIAATFLLFQQLKDTLNLS